MATHGVLPCRGEAEGRPWTVLVSKFCRRGPVRVSDQPVAQQAASRIPPTTAPLDVRTAGRPGAASPESSREASRTGVERNLLTPWSCAQASIDSRLWSNRRTSSCSGAPSTSIVRAGAWNFTIPRIAPSLTGSFALLSSVGMATQEPFIRTISDVTEILVVISGKWCGIPCGCSEDESNNAQ